MRDDLIFHLTTQEDWKTYKKEVKYEPESLDTEGFIHCSSGSQLEDTANRLFSDKEKILLLVIDVSALTPQIKYDEDSETGATYPHIYGPLNVDAIIDKIDIHAEDNGKFEISFSSYS